VSDPLRFDATALTQLCRRHAVSRLALFGSRLKGSARPDSDIDLLVEFERGREPGLIGPPEDRIRLLHMLEAIGDAQAFMLGRKRPDLDNDKMLVYAVLRAVEILGEAASTPRRPRHRLEDRSARHSAAESGHRSGARAGLAALKIRLNPRSCADCKVPRVRRRIAHGLQAPR
jgi:Nucleotidyltransferase domain